MTNSNFIKKRAFLTHMTIIEFLEEYGLSHAEANIYVALLETGSTLVGPIIKKTGLHRGTTYQILQRLKEKGFVSSIIKGKKQYFEPAEPERFMSILKEKEEKLLQILPILNSKFHSNKETQEIKVYSGLKGIHSVMDKMLEELKSGDIYYDYAASGLFREMMGAYWSTWQKRKKKYGIKSYVIFNEEVRKRHPTLLKEYYGKVRFIPKNFNILTDTITYKDHVLLFIWTAKPPVVIVIQNKDNAKSYLNQFKLMWKHAKK